MGTFHGLRSNHGAIFHSRDLIPGEYFLLGRSEQFNMTFASSSFKFIFMSLEELRVP